MCWDVSWLNDWMIQKNGWFFDGVKILVYPFFFLLAWARSSSVAITKPSTHPITFDCYIPPSQHSLELIFWFSPLKFFFSLNKTSSVLFEFGSAKCKRRLNRFSLSYKGYPNCFSKVCNSPFVECTPGGSWKIRQYLRLQLISKRNKSELLGYLPSCLKINHSLYQRRWYASRPVFESMMLPLLKCKKAV
jgi:hypothetical protein